MAKENLLNDTKKTIKVKFNCNTMGILNRKLFNTQFVSDPEDDCLESRLETGMYNKDKSLPTADPRSYKMYHMGRMYNITEDEFKQFEGRTCMVNNHIVGNLQKRKMELNGIDSKFYEHAQELFSKTQFSKPICEIMQ